MTRWRTRLRLSSSAWLVDVGLASMDWQIPPRLQKKRAELLPLPTNHSRLMSGMEITATLALGRPDLSVARAVSICERKVATGVIVDSLLVQASLAPIRMVT